MKHLEGKWVVCSNSNCFGKISTKDSNLDYIRWEKHKYSTYVFKYRTYRSTLNGIGLDNVIILNNEKECLKLMFLRGYLTRNAGS